MDTSWYSGSSFARPVLSGDNPLFNGSWPSSCAYDYGSPLHSLATFGSYVTFDNIEVTGVCWSGNLGGGNPAFVQVGSNSLVEHSYCHGWTELKSATDNYNCFQVGTNSTYDGDVFDGSDAVHFAAGSNCAFDTAAPCATGSGIYWHAATIEHCVFRYLHNMVVINDSVTSAHDNLFEYLEFPPTSTMVSGQHPDVYMVYTGSTSGAHNTFYNNTVRHTYVSEMIYLQASAGEATYIFNNIFYDNQNWGGGNTAPMGCIQLNAGNSGTQTLYVFNNTFDMDTDDATGGGCKIEFWGTSGGNSNGAPWNGTTYAANNHVIGLTTFASLFSNAGSGATNSVNDLGGNIAQATATARSQGYTQSTTPVGDIITSSSGATYRAGTNQSSYCSTFSSDSALCSSTGGGPLEQAADGGQIANFPALPIESRGSAWDAGAYYFGGGTTTGAAPNPPTGLSATVN
ncbi:MAG TPA: hypothetical protein VMH20_15245 [Verrucomicrobiae bacterium]|nr:hypothetical protein [Verrucomicrobiae bacterium]